MTRTWIDTAGGPLICAAFPVGLNWGGASASSTGDSQSDYGRACAVMDYVGVIPCGASRVLVFGDEPLQTTVVRVADGIAIVRWVSCESEDDAEAALEEIPSELLQLEAPKSIQIEAEKLVLFDAACSLGGAPSTLEVSMPPGMYEVSTERFARSGVFEFIVHRVVRGLEAVP